MNTSRTIIEVLNLLIFLAIVVFVFALGGIGGFWVTTLGTWFLLIPLLLVVIAGLWYFIKRNDGEPRNGMGRLLAIIPVLNTVMIVAFIVLSFL